MAKPAEKTGNAKRNGQAEAFTPQRNLPLFFRNPKPLLLEHHAKSGITPSKQYPFATKTNSIPLNLVEFFEAAGSFPIVFTNTPTPLPVALVGIQERNYFLDAKHRWLERTYIPAYVHRYPFIFMRDKDSDRLILCVDEAAPQYRAVSPEKRFYDDGGAQTAFTGEVLKFCVQFEQQHQQTLEFCKALKEQNLLVEKVSTIRLPGGKEARLGGFQMLDGSRIDALPDNLFLAWRKKGWMAALDAVMISYTNWKYFSALAAKKA